MPRPMNPMILVIDADAPSLAAVAATLQSRQYQVQAAGDALTALQLAAGQNLDLIIADVNLRGGDGMDLVERIRSTPEQADVPMMFLSSAQVSDVAYRSVASSSAYFLKKPVSAELLLDLVDKSLWMPHLSRSQPHRPHVPLGTFPAPASAAMVMDAVR